MLKARIYILFALTIIGLKASAQSGPPNLRLYDEQLLHFGFYVGINYYDFRFVPKEDLSQVDDFYGYRTVVNPGYSIGIISDIRLNKNLNFRFIPSFANTERRVYFDMTNSITGERGEQERIIESSLVQAPIELRFKTDRIHNHRWYVLAGLTYSHDLASKENLEDPLVFKLNSTDLSYDFGVGMDFYFEYFKFSPQIKAFWGVRDLTVQDGTTAVSGLEGTYSRGMLFSFTFQ